MELTEELIKEHLEKVQEQAWDSFTYHKTQIHKVAFSTVAFVTSIFTLTKLFGVAAGKLSQAEIDKIIGSGYFVLITLLILLSLMLFSFHHRISVKYYGLILRHCNSCYFKIFQKHKSIQMISSPYYLYRAHVLHKKRLLPGGVGAGHVTASGSLAVTILLVLLYLLACSLVINYFNYGYDFWSEGLQKIVSFICCFSILLLALLTNAQADRLHSHYFKLVKERFDKFAQEAIEMTNLQAERTEQ